MFEPIYKKSRLVVGNPNSPIGIVSLWTKNKKLAERLDPNKYAVIGQLFSAERGLDILVRNLLANPGIRALVITGADFSKSGIILRDFFRNGFERGKKEVTGKECWRVKSEHPGYIELDIPEDALNELRETISINFLDNVTNEELDKIPLPEKVRQKRIIERKDDEVKDYDGDTEGYIIRHGKVAGAWLQILDTIIKFGRHSSTHYDDSQKEVLNLISVIDNEDPHNFHIPEFLPCSKEDVEAYIPRVTTNFVEEGTPYPYGSRMRSWFDQDQVKEAVAKLVRELNSRATVINLWDSRKDLTIGGSPCINHLWLRVRDDKLFLTVTIRSNDMFEAYPENAFGLRMLQEVIRKELNEELRKKGKHNELKLGSLIINSQSAHVYDDCFESARKIIKDNINNYLPQPSETYDRKGSFVIETGDGEIRANHISQKGESMGLYTGKTAKELRDIISRHNLIGNTEHGMYMGLELQKAEFAMLNKLEYHQDEPLLVPAPPKPVAQPVAQAPLQDQDSQNVHYKKMSNMGPITTDGRDPEELPTHGRLILKKRLPETGEMVLTYIVNDKEFKTKRTTSVEEEQFKEFLKGKGVGRVF